ncbi:hypothetical protein KDK92_16265 [Oceanirhabdus seepicola]|uniref:Multicomponent Na+:H+ antiporter subunit B n=1 Tax=Oceanirhabdus seepicola TaxID=2828781 RepID=A0A9J6P3B7_9CLOT|nr:hypothetical protein [Oceanirhabdus seepicola]
MIKEIFIVIMLSTILVTFTISSNEIKKLTNGHSNINTSESKRYYLKNTLKETGSQNIVTGIYLEYRLFDSIFEAGILLITATGIIFISKKDETLD